ncbi:MAG TPA: DNA-directed RNA polymerase subunit omega [Thermoanaerobaculaceae bacterium]|nr:DNA-directed RNA polymerase subunit omega [Thermoanaerobaculaceae bacterium]
MSDLPEGIDSTFRYILIAAKRAEQLISGARARVATRHVKPTTVALAELGTEHVPWRKVTVDEYEMLLQQEVAAKEAEEHAPVLFPIPPPIIPALADAEAEAEAEEEEEEGLEVELEGPKFDENLEVVEEPAPEVLLPPEEISEE